MSAEAVGRPESGAGAWPSAYDSARSAHSAAPSLICQYLGGGVRAGVTLGTLNFLATPLQPVLPRPGAATPTGRSALAPSRRPEPAGVPPPPLIGF
jgi:hypothetical protein